MKCEQRRGPAQRQVGAVSLSLSTSLPLARLFLSAEGPWLCCVTSRTTSAYPPPALGTHPSPPRGLSCAVRYSSVMRRISVRFLNAFSLLPLRSIYRCFSRSESGFSYQLDRRLPSFSDIWLFQEERTDPFLFTYCWCPPRAMVSKYCFVL